MPPEAQGNFAGKHLVVFGCGYIGGEIARQALARDLRVTGLTRNAVTAEALRSSGVTAVVADLATDAWHEKVPAADFALDAVSSGGGGVEGYRRSYLAGMKSVLAWRDAKSPACALVYTSSTSVYPQDGGVAVDESAPVSPRDERAAVLIETEALILGRPQDEPGPRPVILRLAGIYGPGRTHLVEQVRAGEVSGWPDHPLNLIHRDDVCSAIWAALEGGAGRSQPVWRRLERHALHQVYNVVDDQPSRKAEVAAWLAARLGVSPPRFSGAPAGGRRAVTPDRIILNTRLKGELGWAPLFPSFREGYAKFLSP
ncbi:MAG: epimerase [Verrucomicrobia bacterium]|nr:epimerase [Verrucomicrobiota bacterium]